MARSRTSLTIQVRGSVENAEALKEIGERALNGTEAFENIEALMIRGERKLWARFKHGRMVKTGTLKRSLTEGNARTTTFRRHFRRHARSGSTVPGAIREIYPERMRFGSRVPYSVYHQHKGGGVKGKVLYFYPADKKRARDIILDYLTAGWNS